MLPSSNHSPSRPLRLIGAASDGREDGRDASRLLADASLIVTGTHGHGGFASAVLGSVARGLLHESRCPVLAVPPSRVREPALA